MESAAGLRLLEFFLGSEKLESLDALTIAALRLCNKQIRSAIDATITACRVNADDLDHFLSCGWHLTELIINDRRRIQPSPESLKASLTALVGKFPLLKKLECIDIGGFPENIGGFSHLQQLQIYNNLKSPILFNLHALPPSFSQLTALETLELRMHRLTRGLAPLKHLKQLKHLKIDVNFTLTDPSYPEWTCNNTSTSLEHLY